jgi:hypothetical protein
MTTRGKAHLKGQAEPNNKGLGGAAARLLLIEEFLEAGEHEVISGEILFLLQVLEGFAEETSGAAGAVVEHRES